MAEPKWMQVARRELGVREIAGPSGSNPRIEEFLKSAGLHPNDDIAWCSAFVNWCMEQAGLKGTDRGAARSWTRWGKHIDQPRPGCVVVLWREDPNGPKGHVGFFVSEDIARHTIKLLGGNQGNAVAEHSYPAFRLLGYFWPTDEALAAAKLNADGL